MRKKEREREGGKVANSFDGSKVQLGMLHRNCAVPVADEFVIA